MLETGEVLYTYRLDSPPDRLLDQACSAIRIHDHPLRFLTYQGSVNKGLGSVRIVDSGTYQLLEYNTESSRLHLHGKILRGEFHLANVEGDAWRFTRRRE
ncbi:MAG: hypothetical protein JW720_12015 [Sedimentisphaerales bacterium]|nr:hypothetical protein [Sedimentisphaerales bacterium]